MDFECYRRDLLANPFDENNVERILDSYFHSGTPHIFSGDVAADGIFRRALANEINSVFRLNCHPHHLVVCGSARLGFSAKPDKLGKPFQVDYSDTDVAILLPELFDRWWHELVDPRVKCGRHRSSIVDNIFNGYIDPQYVHECTRIGKEWWRLFREFSLGGTNRVRGRIYRDAHFMQNYHRLSVIRGREQLQGARA